MTTDGKTQSQQWYEENILRAREEGRSRCCNAPIEDAGSCYEGCCDRWRCSKCKREWNVEVGD